MNPLMPVVVESGARGEKVWDLPSRLMKDRIIVLYEPIYEETAAIIIMQMLFLDNQDSQKPINFYINSPGGVCIDGLAIYDTMNLISSPVHTVCVGQASSMAAVLLAAGTKRYSLPNSRIMIHQPIGGAYGQATDVQIHADEIKKTRERLESILAKHMKKKPSEIKEMCERDYFMSSEEAKKNGIIDSVITNKKDMEKKQITKD
jgi:ATP-dependent Clp protease protease subunit